jgi:NitT/TauT family transport system permease protein/taurine transport system permease protein
MKAGNTAARRIAVTLALLVIWELVSRLEIISPTIIGSPAMIAQAARKDWAAFLSACGTTSMELAVSIAICWSVGIAAGALLGSMRLLGAIAAPILSALIAIPLIVIYPLLMAWVGLGPESKIAFAVLSGVFPIALNTLIGVRGADRGYALMATGFGATRLQLILHVMLPLAMPSIISGLRIGTSMIIIGVLVAEMLGSDAGLGFLISLNRTLFNTGAVYLGTLLALAMAVIIDAGLSRIGRHFGSWRPSAPIAD